MSFITLDLTQLYNYKTQLPLVLQVKMFMSNEIDSIASSNVEQFACRSKSAIIYICIVICPEMVFEN